MRYVVYPIHIAPTKPLNPTHVRHLLYTDMAYKGLLKNGCEAIYAYNRMSMDVTTQVLKLSEYLRESGLDCKRLQHADEVGNLYVEMTNNEFELPMKKVIALRKDLEESTSGHAYYRAILPEWIDQHRFLNMFDPGLDKAERYNVTMPQLIEFLAENDLLN